MSLWAQIQELSEEARSQFSMSYGDNFPIEVRCALAQWIEEKMWVDLEPDNPQHEKFAASLVASFIEEIKLKRDQEEDFITRIKLIQAAQNFEQNYGQNPILLVRIVKQCLNNDLRIIQQAQNYMSVANQETKPIIHDPHLEISQKIEKFKQTTMEAEEEVRRIQQEQEQFVIQYQETAKRQVYIQNLQNQLRTQPNGQNADLLQKLQKEKEIIDNALRPKANKLTQVRVALIEKYNETLNNLVVLQQRVLDEELSRWQRGQQLSGNGVPFENNLDQIQEWCEALAEIIWQNKQQLKRVELLFQQLPSGDTGSINQRLVTLDVLITNLLYSLVKKTFIIEKQPPQVMKTNTRFTSTIRLLVGGKLNVHMTPPQVRVTIISEAQACSIIKNDRIASCDASGEILNNTGTMEYHQATRQLTVNFRNMQLKKIKRAEKKGTESVMDEKFSLLFQSSFKIGGGEQMQVWTLSLPVVVIVHGNQEPHAWATVTWDNAFGEPVATGRIPFVVPDKVPWSKIGEVLSQKFKAAVGSGLKEEHLRFLACRALRNPNLQDYNNALISWAQFSKDPLPERNFTFWEWFYAILKVTREHLRGIWNDGYIMGFVTRQQTEDFLSKRSSGTFLIRFSESELGGVTIAFQLPTTEIYMLTPLTSRQLVIKGLADYINDFKQFLFLYPDIPKDQAFAKYYTPYDETQPQTSNGYVRAELMAHIPGWSSLGRSFSPRPKTQQSELQNFHSPNEASLSYSDVESINEFLNNIEESGEVLDMDYTDLINYMELVYDMDQEDVDSFNKNVNDLMQYSKSL